MRRELHVVRSERVRDASPLLVLDDGLAEEMQLEYGQLATLRANGEVAPVWIDVRSRYEGGRDSKRRIADEGEAFTSRLTCRYLGIPLDTESFPAVLHAAPSVSLRAQAAIAGDLPPPDVVDVAEESLPPGASDRDRFLAVYGGVAVPVRVRLRAVQEGKVRTTHAFRVLLGLPESGASIRLARLDTAPFRALERHGATDAARLGRIDHARNRTRRLVESGLAPLLGAPKIAMRGAPAVTGDDVARVVRLPPSSFPLLGLAPGDRVLVEWADRGVVAVALEVGDTSSEAELELIRSARRAGGIDHETGTAYEGTVRHLRVRMTAGLRADLGIPRKSVVTIRRSLPPVLGKQLQLLVIPLTGISIAIFTLPGLRWWMAVVAVVVAVTLVVAPVRRVWPRRGSW
jgi:hypothetical protein